MLTKTIKPVSPKVKRIKIKRPVITPLDELKRVMHKYLYLKDDSYIDVTLGAAFANRLDAKPLWMYLVGAPGTGKTDLIQAMDEHSSTFSISTLTSKTLASGYKEDQSKSRVKKPDEDHSLLPHLNNKVVLIKEFSTILKLNVPERDAIFAQLRDIFDGVYHFNCGTKRQTYKSQFGIIGAVTPIIDTMDQSNVSVGARFLTTRMPDLNEEDKYRIMEMMRRKKNNSEKERALKLAVHDVLNQTVVEPMMSKEYSDFIMDAAFIVATARSEVKRDKRRTITATPIIEAPSRPFGQITSWTLGISMARQHQYMVREDLLPALGAAMHSIPPIRLTLLNKLAEVYPNTLSVKDASKYVAIDARSTHDVLGDLECLGLLELKQKGGPKVAAQWACTSGTYEKMTNLKNVYTATESDLNVG